MGKPTFTIFLEPAWALVEACFDGILGWCGESGSEGITEVNKIALVKRTRRTETSQYPEEKTSTEIPLVVASERGPGQCLLFN
jgi:hypothetical protein